MSTLISTIRDLHRRKARERRGLALAEGVRLVEEALAAGVTITGAVAAPALLAHERGRALDAALRRAGTPMEEVADADLVELADTEHPQGVVAVIEPKSWSAAEIVPRAGHPVLVLDAVQDPGNVGTMARSALAFGAAGVLALPGTADLLNSKALRGSMGALFHLRAAPLTDAGLLDWAAGGRAELWAADVGGEDIRKVRVSAHPLAVVVGNEGAGVRKEIVQACTRRVAIPIAGQAESLNVAVAAGILLHEVTRER